LHSIDQTLWRPVVPLQLFFQWCALLLKLWGRPLKLNYLLKIQLLTHPPPITQGCLLHTLNESFSQLVPNQDDLLILKTLFLSQDWIHQKHKYFLCDDLRNLPFLHTSIFVECMGWVEIKGRKRRFYRWEIENAIIPPICRPAGVSLSLSLFIYFEKACVCTSSCDCGSHLPLVLRARTA